MKTQNNLYNVIKSLNVNEKGYFHKLAGTHTIGEKNVYLRLFDEIDKLRSLDEYDEVKLKLKLKPFTSIGNFSVLKKYLYEMILKSMRSYDLQKELDSQINSHIENYHFLNRKNLIRESEDEISKAKKLSLLHERFEKLIEIYKKEKAIIRKKSPVDVSLMIKTQSELDSIIEKVRCNAGYRHLNDLAFAYLHRDGKNINIFRKNFKAILNNPLLKDIKTALTFESKLAFYQIYSAYYFAVDNFLKALEMYENILKLMEAHTVLMKEYSRGYLLILHNCIDVCERMNKDTEAKYYTKKVNDFMNNPSNQISQETRYMMFIGFGISKIVNLILSGNYDSQNPEIKQLEKDFLKNIEFINLSNKVTLIFELAVYYFGCGDFNAALKWLHMIVNKDEELRTDLRIESSLLFLIVHYELKNFDLINYSVKSTNRYLNKKKPLMGIEPIIINFISKASNIKNPDNTRKLFIELRDTLILKKKIADEYAFDFLSWAESKVRNKSFAEIKKEKYAKWKTGQE